MECHAADFSGGITEVNCQRCHNPITVHKNGILNPDSENFHGKYIAQNDDFTDCKSCHGADWNGGIVSPSCQTCHSGIGVHEDGIIDPASNNFHGKYLIANNWDLSKCQQCHSADFSGGVASPSCLTCHTESRGPQACNTCHGDFSNPDRIAPPADLVGNTSTTAKGVGAHEIHVYSNTLAENVRCFDCHERAVVPEGGSFASAHIDGLPAEMKFGSLADTLGNANYDYNTLQCNNVYCHGNFVFKKDDSNNQFGYADSVMVGNNFSPTWNKVDGTQAACGTCHGQYDSSNNLVTVAPVGHIPVGDVTSCANCHTGVVDANGAIIDKTKHINGKANVFGQ